jgi:spermidine synthase
MTSETTSRATRAGIILIPLFFLSGISALAYQVVWLKYLGLVFGNTVHAAATLIATYLGGLGIGAWIFGRWGARRNPLIVYALVEAAIGTIGAFSTNAFGLLDSAYIAAYSSFIDAPVMLAMARLLAASLFLLPPTILMGGTLPLLVRAFAGRRDESGRAVSSLYAANTFGATAGVALSGFFTIPAVGLIATTGIAVALNFVLAAISLVLAIRARHSAAEGEPSREASPATRRAALVLLASAAMGFTSIADEVFWSRIFVLHLGSSVYAYSLMLFSFLIGLAAGSALITRFIGRKSSALLLGWIEVALAVVLSLQIYYFTRFADVLGFFATLFGAASYTATLLTLLSAVLTAILIPTALMGATFPLAVKLFAERSGRESSSAVGSIYFFNTIGSILGSLTAGFLLIRILGSQNSLLLMALINLAIGVGFLLSSTGRRTVVAAAMIGAILIGGTFLLAKKDGVILSAGMFTDSDADVLLFREDVSATVTLRRFPPYGWLSLELNGVNVAGTSPDLMGTQQLQGHIPLLLHPKAKDVLHIGFGSGGTAYAVSKHPVTNITIAEISPEVLEVSGKALTAVNKGVLRDPRVNAVINDGRNYVLAAPEKFDVILSDSIHPRYAGNGSLYTRDYFELCRRKLRPGGVISMWLPFYSLTPRNYLMILRAFSDVFPNTTVWYVPNRLNAFTIVIGRMDDRPIPFELLQNGISGEVQKELATIDIGNAYDLAGALLMDPQRVKEVTRTIEPHIDDLPAVEYESGRLIDRDATWLVNFKLLQQTMSPLGRGFAPPYDEARMEQEETLRRERLEAHIGELEAALSSRFQPPPAAPRDR